jgi:hypothetical protein
MAGGPELVSQPRGSAATGKAPMYEAPLCRSPGEYRVRTFYRAVWEVVGSIAQGKRPNR